MEKNEFQLPQMLKRLETRLLLMFTSVSLALDNAVDALATADKPTAFATIEGDSDIDALERDIDDVALSILVRFHVLAGDLRLVLGALRIINDLERIGDEAVIVARRAALATPEECAAMNAINAPLARLAQQRMQQASDIFKRQDVKAAAIMRDTSNEIVQAEINAVQTVINSLAGQDAAVSPEVAVQSIMVCRALARVCGRAVNLAEHTFFIGTGENIKHADARALAEKYAQ